MIPSTFFSPVKVSRQWIWFVLQVTRIRWRPHLPRWFQKHWERSMWTKFMVMVGRFSRKRRTGRLYLPNILHVSVTVVENPFNLICEKIRRMCREEYCVAWPPVDCSAMITYMCVFISCHASPNLPHLSPKMLKRSAECDEFESLDQILFL